MSPSNATAQPKEPLNPTWGDLQIDKLWVTETDDDGLFQFSDVKPGTYRLLSAATGHAE